MQKINRKLADGPHGYWILEKWNEDERKPKEEESKSRYKNVFCGIIYFTYIIMLQYVGTE